MGHRSAPRQQPVDPYDTPTPPSRRETRPTSPHQATGAHENMEWYHKNYLDHVYGVTDDTGNLLELYRYTAFGQVETYTPTGQQLAGTAIDNPVRWNSRRYDESTNLHYYKYRHYSPKLGRWLGRDPIEEDGGINLYTFVRNQPFDLIDNHGLTPTAVASLIAAFITGIAEVVENISTNRMPKCLEKDTEDKCRKCAAYWLHTGFRSIGVQEGVGVGACWGACTVTLRGGKRAYLACVTACSTIIVAQGEIGFANMTASYEATVVNCPSCDED